MINLTLTTSVWPGFITRGRGRKKNRARIDRSLTWEWTEGPMNLNSAELLLNWPLCVETPDGKCLFLPLNAMKTWLLSPSTVSRLLGLIPTFFGISQMLIVHYQKARQHDSGTVCFSSCFACRKEIIMCWIRALVSGLNIKESDPHWGFPYSCDTIWLPCKSPGASGQRFGLLSHRVQPVFRGGKSNQLIAEVKQIGVPSHQGWIITPE